MVKKYIEKENKFIRHVSEQGSILCVNLLKIQLIKTTGILPENNDL